MVAFAIRHAVASGRPGLALRYQQSESDGKNTLDAELKLTAIYQTLGWKHVTSHLERTRPVRYMAVFRPM